MPLDRIERATVVGTTAWGTMLAVLLARNGVTTTLLARTAEEAARLHEERTHPRLPDVTFPGTLHPTAAASSLADAQLVCFVVPAQTMADNAAAAAAHVPADATVLTASKGIELSTRRRMTEVLAEALPGRPLAALSGPNLSREVAAGLPGSTVIAATPGAPVEAVAAAFHGPHLRVYTSSDVVGVELGGALKNIVAIAAGMADALEVGDNAKAAILTRGLAEMTRLGVAAGADPLTFQGLAGVGDLVATSYSRLSRNRTLGELVASGATLDGALTTLGETAEGAATLPAALRLAADLGVELPIAAGLERILYGGAATADVVAALLGREPKPELRDVERPTRDS